MIKIFFRIIVYLLILTSFASCGKSTKEYAKDEDGKVMGCWVLRYHANDNYSIYYPKLVMSEIITAEGYGITYSSPRSYYSFRPQRDSSYRSMDILPVIRTYKSKNDGSYYESIQFAVSDDYSRSVFNFVFNEGTENEISFSAILNDNDCLVPKREISEAILSHLYGNDDVNVRVYFEVLGGWGKNFYDFSFKLTASPELIKATKINRERTVLAYKELEKLPPQDFY